ncbi:DUF4335 domain-containing protein [Leptolyngbya sp. AN02str]|uniref:DUF4335 domain-containing protein n=1 Tax=Leptolyngbya sp. AN02str TaxID=3423363 RepID=UPI003D31F623
MTLQREYYLPNCKLVVEGVADDVSNPAFAGRPPMSIVTHVECHLSGVEPPLTGGREFLESLAAVVSGYAQECLSGISHFSSRTHHGAAGSVHIERMGAEKHRLTLVSSTGTTAADNGAIATAAPATRQIDLQTVQLFDLVEAIDQLLSDRQTLPGLELNLAPVSRRFASTQVSATQRFLPAALGLASLVAAGFALFFLPIPERRPEPEPNSTESPAASPAATTGASPNPPAAIPAEALTEEDASPEATPSPQAESDADASETTAQSVASSADDAESNAEQLPDALNAPAEITEVEQLDQLKLQLRDSLDTAWTQDTSFDEELVYRVSVAQDGDILGFRYFNDAAVQYVGQTPLPDLRYNPAGSPPPEAVADFRVVFTPQGVVQVSPWYGTPPQ